MSTNQPYDNQYGEQQGGPAQGPQGGQYTPPQGGQYGAPQGGPGAPQAAGRPGWHSNLAIAGLVCGIAGIPLAIVIAAIGGILGILGLVFGIVTRRQAGGGRFALAAIICGAVAIVVAIVNGILGAVLAVHNLQG